MPRHYRAFVPRTTEICGKPGTDVTHHGRHGPVRGPTWQPTAAVTNPVDVRAPGQLETPEGADGTLRRSRRPLWGEGGRHFSMAGQAAQRPSATPAARRPLPKRADSRLDRGHHDRRGRRLLTRRLRRVAPPAGKHPERKRRGPAGETPAQIQLGAEHPA